MSSRSACAIIVVIPVRLVLQDSLYNRQLLHRLGYQGVRRHTISRNEDFID